MKQLSITDSQRTIGEAIMAHIPTISAQFREAISYVENVGNWVGTKGFDFAIVGAPLLNPSNISDKKLQQAFALLVNSADLRMTNKFTFDEKTLTCRLNIFDFVESHFDLLMLESYVKTFHTMVHGAVIQRKGWYNIM
jgi:hypothetical protein